MYGPPLSPRKKELLRIIAERALRRGRKFTATEQLRNLETGLELEPGTLAIAIRARIATPEQKDGE